MILRLSVEVLEAMRAHARRCSPEECCGALISMSEGLCAVPLPNSAPEKTSGYLISARAYLEAERIADARSGQLIGFFHSHPTGSPAPSSSDLATAVGGFFYVIVGRDGAVTRWFAPGSGGLEPVTSP